MAGSARLNFRTKFSQEIQKFEIDVDPEFILLTKQKVQLSRLPIGIVDEDSSSGPNVEQAALLQQFWSTQYDWFVVQDSLNQKFEQFTTIVDLPETSQYEVPLPLHFVHHVSDRSDAIPLLFIHGWPGSFLEVGNIIKSLTHPPNASLPAFNVVAPSIPGFAFSPAPVRTGFGYIEAAHAFQALMVKLGYTKYVIQAGDAGGIIMRYQAHLYPDSVISGLNNFWVVSPSDEDRAKYRQKKTSPDEDYVIELLDGFVNKLWGYGQIQQTRPLRLAYAMTDSPIGLAAWLLDAVWNAVEDSSVWTSETLITWTMMLWIQGPYASFRLYREGALGGAFDLTKFNDLPYVNQPMAISEFPRDIWYRTPLQWAQRTGNVKKRYLHEKGGHFPAWETPNLLLEDIWDFWSNK